MLVIGDGDGGAFGGERLGDGGADAACAAGYQCDLSGEAAGHIITSPRSMLRAWPVMFAAASDARNRYGPTMSFGSINPPIA